MTGAVEEQPIAAAVVVVDIIAAGLRSLPKAEPAGPSLSVYDASAGGGSSGPSPILPLYGIIKALRPSKTSVTQFAQLSRSLP
jgi:hypothetical protein